VGRNSNADPKWLLPMICRRGHVTKKDIGQIRIFDRETKFEIARDAVDRFKAAVAGAPGEPIRIEPAGAPGARPTSDAQGPRHVEARPAKASRPEPAIRTEAMRPEANRQDAMRPEAIRAAPDRAPRKGPRPKRKANDSPR
jgi:ATP-dependent RNA helicase DeaD